MPNLSDVLSFSYSETPFRLQVLICDFSQEIRKLAEGSETYSPCVQSLYTQLGIQAQNRYHILQKSHGGILNKNKSMYSKYVQWYMSPGCDNQALNTRQKWQMLTYESSTAGPDLVSVSKKIPIYFGTAI